MIARQLRPTLLRSVAEYPVVTLTGPRQSGKTTLLRAELSDWQYVSLENPDERASALADPRGFLARFPGRVILDEVQRTPDLFSYIQGIVDERRSPGQYVLSGSHNFLLLQTVSQTLAGRTRILHLLPFSLAELAGRPPLALGTLRTPSAPRAVAREPDLEAALLAGFYPPIHDRRLRPAVWLADYYQTYLERDVRDVLKVGDLDTFDRFVRLVAGRTGQLLNLSGLAADCGVSHSTARRWLSVLEASFQVLQLRPWFGNVGKRFIRSPKLYVLDTGMLCFLLGIRDVTQLSSHPLRGPIFETFVIAELLKNFTHRGELPRLWFWRDSRGREVDVLVGEGSGQVAIEVKAGRTVTEDALAGVRYWRTLPGNASATLALVYGGGEPTDRGGIPVLPWHVL